MTADLRNRLHGYTGVQKESCTSMACPVGCHRLIYTCQGNNLLDILVVLDVADYRQLAFVLVKNRLCLLQNGDGEVNLRLSS